jgi:membrane fusion protein, multidrug efflux system
VCSNQKKIKTYPVNMLKPLVKRSAILVILLAAACGKKEVSTPGQSRQQRTPEVDGFIVKVQSVSDRIEVPGSLMPAEQTQIRSEVSGRVVQLNIVEGSVVQKGALLVKLFDGDLQTQLKRLQVQLQIAEKTEERQRELLAIKGISQQDYDLAELNVQTLKVDIEATQIAIIKTEIRAPYSGQLGLRSISLGAYISPTDIITTLRQVSELKLEFSVPEKYAKEVKAGDKISFRVDGGLRNHTATVIATENSVEQTTRTLRIRGRVDKIDRELVPGVFARVNLQLGKNTKALLVPTQALISTARNKQVALLKKDSVIFSVVETGVRDSAYVQVTQGLTPGDTIITTGLMVLKPNSKVKVVRVEK